MMLRMLLPSACKPRGEAAAAYRLACHMEEAGSSSGSEGGDEAVEAGAAAVGAPDAGASSDELAGAASADFWGSSAGAADDEGPEPKTSSREAAGAIAGFRGAPVAESEDGACASKDDVDQQPASECGSGRWTRTPAHLAPLDTRQHAMAGGW